MTSQAQAGSRTSHRPGLPVDCQCPRGNTELHGNPGRAGEPEITFVNMHETVTSTGLDNSHVVDHDVKFYYHRVAKVDDWDSHLT